MAEYVNKYRTRKKIKNKNYEIKNVQNGNVPFNLVLKSWVHTKIPPKEPNMTFLI